MWRPFRWFFDILSLRISWDPDQWKGEWTCMAHISKVGCVSSLEGILSLNKTLSWFKLSSQSWCSCFPRWKPMMNHWHHAWNLIWGSPVNFRNFHNGGWWNGHCVSFIGLGPRQIIATSAEVTPKCGWIDHCTKICQGGFLVDVLWSSWRYKYTIWHMNSYTTYHGSYRFDWPDFSIFKSFGWFFCLKLQFPSQILLYVFWIYPPFHHSGGDNCMLG